ncbi:MAG: YczE/YyaS/YitT family protein [Fusobacteriaceae bacterium]
MKTKMKLIYRVLIYIIGLFFLSLGMAFAIKSNLGLLPVTSLPYMLSLITKIEVGILTICIFCIYILLQFLIMIKDDFQIKNFLQILFTTIFGYFVSFSLRILSFIPIQNTYMYQLIFLGISILLVGLGLSLVIIPDLVPSAPEGLILVICKKTKIDFSKIKTIFDSSTVFITICLSLIFFGEIVGVREGTVISALIIGKVAGIFMNKLKDPISKVVF